MATNAQFHSMLTSEGVTPSGLMAVFGGIAGSIANMSEDYLGELSPMQTPDGRQMGGMQAPGPQGGVA